MIEKIQRILTASGNRAKPITLKEIGGGCIVCISHKMNTEGYLRLRRNGKEYKAHRIVYEAYRDPIPEEMCVCHRCDNPSCLNPEHFFLGTQADNMKDMSEKGRSGAIGNTWNRGEGSGNSKLTDEDVLFIRMKYRTGKYTQKILGIEYGVVESNISQIVNRKTWNHVGDEN